MRITNIVRVDSKGRITIPLFIREALDVEEGRFLVLIGDIERKELILTPISSEKGVVYEITVELQDRPGALADFTSVLKDLGLDILASRCSTIQRGEIGECTVIAEPVKERVSSNSIEDELKKRNFIFIARVKPLERGV